jgi:hypothetical protein
LVNIGHPEAIKHFNGFALPIRLACHILGKLRTTNNRLAGNRLFPNCIFGQVLKIGNFSNSFSVSLYFLKILALSPTLKPAHPESIFWKSLSVIRIG